MTQTQMRIGYFLLAAGFALSYLRFFPTFSADLMAVWLAGKFLAMGMADQVYPPLTDFFQMYPPDGWRPFMLAEYDYRGPIYPFLYAPLWAKMASLTAGVDFWVITVYALFLNAALQMGAIWLAWRTVAPHRLNFPVYVALAMAFMLQTVIGTLSLQQNQPQILVSFLLVLAIERASRRADNAAGIALALAASLKLYPALFALFWIGTRNWRALRAFVLAGGALAALSVVWAGWPMHVAFLQNMNAITNTVFLTNITFNFDATVAQFFYFDHLEWLPSDEAPRPGQDDLGWYAAAKPALWRAGSTLMLLALFVLSFKAFLRASHADRYAIVMPFSLTALVLVLPLSWPYYLIPTVCFAPAIIDRLGWRRGALFFGPALFLIFAPLVPLFMAIRDWLDSGLFVYQLAGLASTILLAIGFWKSAKAGQPAP